MATTNEKDVQLEVSGQEIEDAVRKVPAIESVLQQQSESIAKISKDKANATDVYTKDQTDDAIATKNNEIKETTEQNKTDILKVIDACCDTVVSNGNYNLFKISEVSFSSRLQDDVAGITSSTVGNAVTGWIPVEYGKYYSMSYLYNGSRETARVSYTRMNLKLRDGTIVVYNKQTVPQTGAHSHKIINIEYENAVAMMLHFAITNESDSLQDISTVDKLKAFEPMIVEGDTPDEAYQRTMTLDYVDGDTEMPAETKLVLKSDDRKVDKIPTTPYYRHVNWGIVPTDYFRGCVDSYPEENFTNSTLYTDYITKFKALITGQEAYVTEINLGNASDGQPIYAYNFKPVKWGYELTNIPKIVIIAGQHGWEKCNVFGLYYFVKDLLNNWSDSTVLEYLRHHIELVIVPVVNTYGFDNFEYKNANGVNINRNYSSNWTLVDDAESSQYGGAEPFDQPESQIIRDLVLNNSDCVLLIDSHTNSTTNTVSWEKLGYYGVNNRRDEYFNRLRDALSELVFKISPNFNVDYNLNAPNTIFGFMTSSEGNGILRTWACDNNILSILIEGFAGFIEGEAVSADIFKANEEQMVNWLITAINYLSK